MSIKYTQEQCEEYLRKHIIWDLFEELQTAILYQKPENVKEFLIKELEAWKTQKTNSLPLFSEKEIENVFYLYNLKEDEFITQQRAKEALMMLTHSEELREKLQDNQELPNNVDLETFKELAVNCLGIQIHTESQQNMQQ